MFPASSFPRPAFRVFVVGILSAAAMQGAPRIFYSDLDSGPNTGGENNRGAYVTIYGRGFGAAGDSSYVTIGGGRAAAYPVWTDSKIALQLGALAATGNIVVTTPGGTSNPVPFSVRTGKLYFVAANGRDGASGSYTSPWRSLVKARDAIAAGDTVYVREGVAAAKEDGEGWNSCLTLGHNAGAAGKPKAFVVYPGESATIGSTTGTQAGGCDTGIRAKGQGESYWTFAGFNLRGGAVALNPYGETGWRIVANDISCPNGNGQAGCLNITNTSDTVIFGNAVHDVGTNLNPTTITALYHGVYFSDAVHDIDFGWNTIARIQGCRGLQQHSSNPAPVAYGLRIHDNVIHDTQCDGIVMTTMDPSKGPVQLYNNVIYNAGKGPNNLERSGAWSCMNLQAYDTGAGSIEVYHNTFYKCGSFANPPYGDSQAGLLWVSEKNSKKYVHFFNNVVYSLAGVPYVLGESSGIWGSNNLFYGNGSLPSNSSLSKSIFRDPLFVNAAAGDFHLLPSSPAHGAGIMPGAAPDNPANPRTAGPASDLGAFQTALP